MRRLMVWLGIVAGGYLAICLLVFLFQDRLLFVAAGMGRGAPLEVPAGAEVLELPLDGEGSFRVALTRPSGQSRGVMVFFLGNGEDLRSGLRWGQEFAVYGLVSVVVEYPGYGDSDGRPGKADFYVAADRAMEVGEREAKAADLPMLAGGSSLGTTLAVYLASQSRVDRLLLRAPPTSIQAAARYHYPWLPTGLIIREELCFDSLALA
ncbi:MAG: alpha/beta hydrolase family protein, partial [Planctomycetota bacterium]